MDAHKILQKIAYCYYLKFKELGLPPDPERDWRYAEQAYSHLCKPKDEGYYFWRQHEEDYGEFRRFLEDEDFTRPEEDRNGSQPPN